jgi:hypothetical protein
MGLIALWLSKQEHKQLVVNNVGNTNDATTPALLLLLEEDNNKTAPVVIAHAVSLIKCGRVASVTGFLDAAAVLRHSIHQQSIHHTTATTGGGGRRSKYSYHMYAIVHTDCEDHAPLLETLGYTTMIRDSPVALDTIREGWYRDHVEGENCCGSREFIKLFAYELEDHPVVVHWDLDVAVLQPMDDLFDSMLLDASSEAGAAARSRLELQFPSRPLPDRIDAFFTRDITSSQPWERVQGVQGGFLVARPDGGVLQQYVQIIQQANYTASSKRGDGSGWGGLGYGGFQGAMAYQGIVAYYYDHFHKGAVELNACRWNQVVADVLWRGPARKEEYHLKCRQQQGQESSQQQQTCEDCRITPIERVKTVHFTACKKPWECALPHPRKTRNAADQYRVDNLTNVTTCGRLFEKWFALRRDFEAQLEKAAGVLPPNRDGSHEVSSFLGYCKGRGNYIPMNPPPQDFNASKLYGM